MKNLKYVFNIRANGDVFDHSGTTDVNFVNDYLGLNRLLIVGWPIEYSWAGLCKAGQMQNLAPSED